MSTMAESRLYSFSPETKEKLRKFRLSTSRAKDPQAAIYIIDSKNQEIRPESDDVYSKMEDLADELPESSPRFILLSYPLTMESGRLTVPYVLLYFLPENCNPSLRMMYAGAVELMRSTAEVNRVLEVQTEEDITSIEARLKGAD
ncbi:GMF family [Aspergillus sp. HF37]|nr:GMF family [Aspergillus sp. HF37]